MEPSNLRAVVSNTGPLISALQCNCIHILLQFYDQIHIPADELVEYEKHGAGQEIQTLLDSGIMLVHKDLTIYEKEVAKAISEEIAATHATKDKDPAHHLPESQAIVLMQRSNLGAVELLIDEMAAREVARSRGVPIIGFPGILIRACQQGMMSPEEVKSNLEECQRQGTHYSPRLIDDIYHKLLRH